MLSLNSKSICMKWMLFSGICSGSVFVTCHSKTSYIDNELNPCFVFSLYGQIILPWLCFRGEKTYNFTVEAWELIRAKAGKWMCFKFHALLSRNMQHESFCWSEGKKNTWSTSRPHHIRPSGSDQEGRGLKFTLEDQQTHVKFAKRGDAVFHRFTPLSVASQVSPLQLLVSVLALWMSGWLRWGSN